MVSPVFRFHLPHLFWFLFGCSVLWKVGRLKPDPANEQIRVIIDGPGEIGRISRADPRGTAGLSPSSHGVVIEVPREGGGRFVAVAIQVWNMLEYWPKIKATLKGVVINQCE